MAKKDTGPIHHADMHDHLPPLKDSHVHESHRKGNKEYGGAGTIAGGCGGKEKCDEPMNEDEGDE